MAESIQKQIFAERQQIPDTRTRYIEEVEKSLNGRTLVTFFTSFNTPSGIDDQDCDMLQSVLQHIDLSNGLALMINSPGGDGLAAERIVNTCRSYSRTGDYWALVPGRAKSAGTIICMGASKIMMAASSELGPIDPQITRKEGNEWRQYSAYSLVSGYDTLFKNAVLSKGHLEPFLQQLTRYDIRDINRYRDSIKLSENMAIKALKTGIMARKTDAQIRKDIRVFLDPAAGTISHGRSIYREEARACGLIIDDLDVHSPEWRPIYELYARTEMYVSSGSVIKTVESVHDSFYVRPP